MRTGGKLLVVDDHEPTLEGLRGLLEAAGHTVWTPATGVTRFGSSAVSDPMSCCSMSSCLDFPG